MNECGVMGDGFLAKSILLKGNVSELFASNAITSASDVIWVSLRYASGCNILLNSSYTTYCFGLQVDNFCSPGMIEATATKFYIELCMESIISIISDKILEWWSKNH